MDKKFVTRMARSLADAEKSRKPVAPLTDWHTEMTTDDAYAVQLATVEARVASGGVIIGKKIGLTSKAIQDAMGVHEPDYGHLYADMIWPGDVPVSLSRLIQPRVEAELAFVMGEDLKGPGVNMVDVLRCTAAVIPAFEVVDSRIQDWKIKIQDTIADNGSSAGIVLGSRLCSPHAENLKHIGLVLEKNGTVLATAAGAAVLGHPAQSMAWLANKLGSMDSMLKKGEIILSGSFTQAFTVAAGETYTATFGNLGSVSITFSA